MTQFSEAQIESLKAPLSRDNVKTRKQGNSELSYVEAWHAIDEANRIFGFDAWDRETIECKCVMERERKIGQGQYQRDGWGVTYTAKVRITVGRVIREGTGAGHGIDADLGLAHESAIKEAESDAMKRAFMTFGNPFGLALYDKTQSNVEGAQSAEKTKPQEPVKQESKANSRELYAKLVEDMRLCKLTADLARWWKDAECVALRHKLPTDWQKTLHEEFVALGFALKEKEDAKPRDVVADIEDTFPGSIVVNERVMSALEAGE
jgi:DNA repair and recombination protein RAD52